MRKISGLLLNLTAVFAFSAIAWAGDFEGVIHMKITHASRPEGSTMDWYFKGDKARMEMGGKDAQSFTAVVDYRRRVMMMPMPGEKAYMEISMDSAGEQQQETAEQYQVDRTGKTEKIAGYSCEIWLFKEKQTGKLKSEACVAKGFGNAAGMMTAGGERGSRVPAWVKQLGKEGAFGLRMITRTDQGVEQMRMEVTSIEKKRLDAALFAMPADYKKLDRETLMGGIGGLGETGASRGKGPGPGGVDLQKMMRDMQKQQAEQGESAGDHPESGTRPNMDELMKQFGDMMKKQPGSR